MAKLLQFIAVVSFFLATLLCSSALVAAGTPVGNGYVRLLRFSPDGRYVLAQDDSRVTILAVDPLAVLLWAPAENAGSADFTPDSRDVMFVSAGYLERWHISDGSHMARIPVTPGQCETETLSPDGRALACVDSAGTLALADLVSGEVVRWKNALGTASIDRPWQLGTDKTMEQSIKGVVTYSGERGSARIAFSPDGRFLVAVPKVYDSSGFAWDRRENRKVTLGEGLKRLRWAEEDALETPHFVFVTPDRLVISGRWSERMIEPATVVTFPSGKVMSKLKIPPGVLHRATDTTVVIVRPYGRYTPPPSAMKAFAADGFSMVYPYSQYGAVAVEMSTGQVITSDTPALDVLGKYYIEAHTGEVGLYERGKGLKASVSLEAR